MLFMDYVKHLQVLNHKSSQIVHTGHTKNIDETLQIPPSDAFIAEEKKIIRVNY